MSVIKRQTYLVALNDGTEHRLTIKHGDRMRAELEAPRHGLTIGPETAQHTAALVVWAALVREGLYARSFQEFKADDLDDLEPVAAPDPTQPPTATASASTASASASPASSAEAPPTGSTPA